MADEIDAIIDFLKEKFGREDDDLIHMLRKMGRMSDEEYQYIMDKRAGEDL